MDAARVAALRGHLHFGLIQRRSRYEYLSARKLDRSVEAARAAKPDGIAIFSAGSLKSQNLWPIWKTFQGS